MLAKQLKDLTAQRSHQMDQLLCNLKVMATGTVAAAPPVVNNGGVLVLPSKHYDD